MKGIVISSDGNRATQYKILKDGIPVFCAKKGFTGVGGIVHDMKDWVENNFYPDAPTDAERRTFSRPYNTVLCQESVTTLQQREVQDQDVNGDPLEDINGDPIMIMEDHEVITQVPVYGEKWVITNETLQKIVIGKYKRTVQELKKKWYCCQEEKKLVIAMIGANSMMIHKPK